jgi:hypothetical protein
MKTIIIFTLLIFPVLCNGQQSSYDIAVSLGAYNSPSFKQADGKKYFSADFDYHLPRRFTISSGFKIGRFAYYDDVRSNDPTSVWGANNTNAQGEELHAYAMVKYMLVNLNGFTLQAGTGIGLLNQKLEYPFTNTPGIGSFTEQASFTDLEFPVSLEGYYLFRNRFGVGFKAGGFVEPDFPIVGIYIGPQLRIRL